MQRDVLETDRGRRRLWTEAWAEDVVAWIRRWPRRDRGEGYGA
jgi:hypothetical protein